MSVTIGKNLPHGEWLHGQEKEKKIGKNYKNNCKTNKTIREIVSLLVHAANSEEWRVEREESSGW